MGLGLSWGWGAAHLLLDDLEAVGADLVQVRLDRVRVGVRVRVRVSQP